MESDMKCVPQSINFHEVSIFVLEQYCKIIFKNNYFDTFLNEKHFKK